VVPASTRLSASFRDPAGFLFERDGVLYRQVNAAAAGDYDRMMQSGFHRAAVERGLLVGHEEVAWPGAGPDVHRILRPRRVPFVSYPYEWSFTQLRDAALLTLELQRCALAHGLSLKDASGFNVQFDGSRPVFIDSLSFEAYREGEPWVAYQQFCRHFLAPLALMAHRDVALGRLLRTQIDGVAVELASRLLPRRTWLSPALLVHLHLHARALRRWADTGAAAPAPRRGQLSRTGLLGLVDHLEAAVRGLAWRPGRTAWGDYYADTSYSEAAAAHKAAVIEGLLDAVAPQLVWDLGANTGRYASRSAARGIPTVAFDGDPLAVDRAYRDARDRDDPCLLPLVMDLTNPSPDLGWDHAERRSLAGRGPADLVLALALVHHLAITNNVPFPALAAALGRVARTLVIEWVPAEDSQVARMLARRPVPPHDYTEAAFAAAFGSGFRLVQRVPVRDSLRVLYVFARV
jgi:hypothetical protein